ncbi:MAG: hypothetical protein UW12_C0035G0003 [Parcubacteria group bacterium GW2011_GWF1_43_9]|nr:MAG: hypothetical protein UW12_C0035G0003 [Parcubacteria group bacterium GW2011_GWF1_43_9]
MQNITKRLIVWAVVVALILLVGSGLGPVRFRFNGRRHVRRWPGV